MNLLDCYALAKLHTLAVTSKCHKYFRLFPAELAELMTQVGMLLLFKKNA